MLKAGRHRREAGGAARVACLAFLAASCRGHSASAETWTPPPGVPAPGFGISEVAGPFTHYVDNTHPSATDTGNPNGTPSRPRLTVPDSLAAGSVVEVRGGPYGGSSTTTWTGSGTAGSPVFIRGVGGPVFQGVQRRIEGSYLVVEGLVFDGVAVLMRGDHLSFRGNEVRHFAPARHSSTLWFRGSDWVVYDNHIHHNGDPDSPTEIDVHGVNASTGALRLWIVDNHIHHNGGDAVQIGGVTTEPWARYVYIARNRLHEDRENAVDIKQARDVVISQNEAWGYKGVDSSDGTAVVVHDNPERVWVLFNEIHSSMNGVRNNGSTVSYIVGNLIRNIHHDPGDGDYDPDSVWSSGAGVLSWRTGELHVVNNTFYDVDAGISYPDASGRLHLANNIIARLAQPSHHVGISQAAVASASRLHYTLMEAPTRIKWGSRSVDIRAFRNAIPGQCHGCLDTAPLFMGRGDFRLQPGSPAVDAGIEDPVYATFARLYGLGIARDLGGMPRPGGPAFDLGAYER